MKKRSDGRYMRKITLPDGTKKYVYGASTAEVNQKVRDLLNAADAGIKLDSQTTVGEWAVEWFATYKQGLRPATLAWYKNAYNNHIYDFLQKLPLKQVRAVHIQKVMNGVAEKSEGLQKQVLCTLRQIFDTARMNGLIIKSPVEGIKITPRSPDSRIKMLSPEQQEALMKAVEHPQARLFCAIGLYTGLRRGEILGLMWSDIRDGSLSVNRCVKFINNQQEENHELKNSSSYRTVPIPPPLQEILDATPRKNASLFTAAGGRPMTRCSFNNMWRHVTSVVDFRVHPHKLRHTYATSLYRAGIDLKTAQYLLGHADIKMTADIYTHIEKGQVESAREKLEALWGSPKTKEDIVA